MWKGTVNFYSLAYVEPHNLCIERGDLVPRKLDLTLHHVPNRCLSPEEVRDALALRSTYQKYFEVNKKSQALKVRKC